LFVSAIISSRSRSPFFPLIITGSSDVVKRGTTSLGVGGLVGGLGLGGLGLSGGLGVSFPLKTTKYNTIQITTTPTTTKALMPIFVVLLNLSSTPLPPTPTF
jgi:hypothetical protein